MHFLSPEVVSRTQEVLATKLLDDIPLELALALQPRMTALLAEIGAGFVVQVRHTILREQEEIKAALLSERKRAEAALRRSEASLAEAQRIAHIGHWDYYWEGDTLFWSEEIFRIFGVSKGEFGGTFEDFFRFIHPDDVGLFQQAGGDSLRGGPIPMEHRIIRPDGEIRTVHQRLRFIFAEDPSALEDRADHLGGEEVEEVSEAKKYLTRILSMAGRYTGERLVGRPVRVLGTVQDVTERKWAEEELRRANDELELRVRERTSELAQTNQELRAEIARRERSEEALREGEAKYRTLVEQIPAVTYIKEADVGEPDWNIVYVSPQIEALLGYSPEEYTSGQNIWEQLLHPDDRERVLAEDARTEKTGESFRVQYRMLTRDGEVAWIRDEAILVCDEEGNPLFWQGVMYDITDQKRAEEEARRLNENLERRVAERTAQLEAYAERLRQSNRELQDFAYCSVPQKR
jgi:PAS domain S-box-containing protein